MIMPVNKTGWIPYTLRNNYQKRMTDQYHERIGTFAETGSCLSSVPDRVIMHELEIKATGALLPRIWQQTGSCLPPDALVTMSDGTHKPISAVVEGDLVRTHRSAAQTVIGTQKKRTEEHMRCLRVDSEALRCTDNHLLPVWSNNAIVWTRAKNVVVGQRLLVAAGVSVEGIATPYGTASIVVSNDAVHVPQYDVWDIEVANDHTFIADGFVVHNCVGCGGARAYTLAQVGDVVCRGDQEEIKIPFPFATYGVGREISGARGKGEGSFGGAQAKAIRDFGMLPWDFENSKIPKPTIKNGWAAWRSSEEMTWSHPNAWPIRRSELEPESQKYTIQSVTQAQSTDDLVQGIAQGYSGTIACMFGTRKCVVQGDVLIAPWNDEWAHQQCIAGYWIHPKLGLIFIIDNQWNDVHGECPTLGPIGVNGSYWMLEKDMAKILKSRDGEVYLHSNTKGFPLRTIDWSGVLGI